MERSATTMLGKSKVEKLDHFLDEQWRFFPFLAELQSIPGEYPLILMYVHIIVDALQVLSFALLPQHNWGTVMTGMLEALNFSHIPLYSYLNAGFYACFAVTAILALAFIIIFIYVVVQCLYMDNYVLGSSILDCFAFRVLRSFLYLASSILFVPFVENFVAVAFVKPNSDGSLLWFPSHATGNILVSLALVISIVGVLLHTLAAAAFGIFFLDCDTNSSHPLARGHAMLDSPYLLWRLVCCVLYQYFYATDQMVYMGVFMAVSSLLMALSYSVVMPYYREWVNRSRIATLWVTCIYSIFASTTHASSVEESFVTKQSNADVAVLCCTFPIVAWLAYHYGTRLRVSGMYTRAMRALMEADLAHPVIHFPKNLPRGVESYTRNLMLLNRLEDITLRPDDDSDNDFAGEFDDEELEDEIAARIRGDEEEFGMGKSITDRTRKRFLLSRFVCPYVNSVLMPTDVELCNRFLLYYGWATGIELSGYQIRYAATIYLKGMAKYPEHSFPRFAYVIFLLHQVRTAQIALDVLKDFSRHESPLWISFQVWRLEGNVSHELHLGQNNRVSALNRAKDSHREALQSTTAFWHFLLNSQRTYGDLSGVNYALIDSQTRSKAMYQVLLAGDAGNMELLSCYSIFCDQIIDDRDMSAQCVQFIRQAIETREQNKMRGAKMKAAVGASLTQLKLSLNASSKGSEEFLRSSPVLFLRSTLIILSIFVIMLLVAILVVIVVYYNKVHSTEHCVYYVSALRTLATQIAVQVRMIQLSNTQSQPIARSILNILDAYRTDFMSIFNEVTFGTESSVDSSVRQFYRTYAVRNVEPGMNLNYWSFFSIFLAGLMDIIARPTESVYIDWIAGSFINEATTALNQAVDIFDAQLKSQVRMLNRICIPLLAAGILLQGVIALLIFHSIFRVKGIRSTTFGLLRLIPVAEINIIYKRSLRQHLGLDAFFGLPTRDKVLRLISAMEEVNRLKMERGGQDTYYSLLQRAADLRPMDAISARTLLRSMKPGGAGDAKAQDDDDGDTHSESDHDIWAHDDSEESDGGTDSDTDHGASNNNSSSNNNNNNNSNVNEQSASAVGGAEGLAGGAAAAKTASSTRRRQKKRRNQRQEEENEVEHQSIISEQTFLLSHDRLSSRSSSFTLRSAFLFFVCIGLAVAIIVINSVTMSDPNDAEDYYSNLMNELVLLRTTQLHVIRALLSAASFNILGQQRYFAEYVAIRGTNDVENVRINISPQMTDISTSSVFFQFSKMYGAIMEVLDISVRLSCSNYMDNCHTNQESFEQVYLANLTWGNEADLVMCNHAPQLGIYWTDFPGLNNSEVAFSLTEAQQQTMGASILQSHLINDYVAIFFTTLEDLGGTSSDSSITHLRNFSWVSVVMGVILTLLLAWAAWESHQSAPLLRRRTIWFLRAVGILSAVTIVVLSSINVAKLTNISGTNVIQEVYQTCSTWTVVIYDFLWYPLLYLQTYNMYWNYKLYELRTTYKDWQLVDAMMNINPGGNYSSATLAALAQSEKLNLIGMALVFAATKNDPNILPYSSIFDGQYLENVSWDFTAEADYLNVLATYSPVDPLFYSTTTADLALPQAQMISLAANTIISNRQDNAVENLFTFITQTEVSVQSTLDTLIHNLQVRRRLMTVSIIMSGVVLFCVLTCFVLAVVLHSLSFVRATKKPTVSSDPRSMTNSRSADDGGEGADDDPAASARAALAGSAAVGGATSSASSGGGGGGGGTASVQGSERGGVAVDAMSDASKKRQQQRQQSASDNLMSSQAAERGSSRNSYWHVALPFICLSVVSLLMLAIIIVLLVSVGEIEGQAILVKDSTMRSWTVCMSIFYSAPAVVSESQYVSAMAQLQLLYAQQQQVINQLYFKNVTDTSSGYGIIMDDAEQDEILFARNKFYDTLSFLGPVATIQNSDGFQVLPTASTQNTTSTTASNTDLFCSAVQQEAVMQTYARGVGLMYDAVWPNFLRRAFSGSYTAFNESYQSMSAVYTNLLVGIDQSNSQYFNHAQHVINTYMIVLIILLIVAIIIVALIAICVLFPFAMHLIHEDANSRTLLKCVPPDIRARYPVLTDFLSNDTRVLSDAERLNETMSEMVRSAVVVSDHRGRIIRFNELAEKLFGYSTAEIINRNVSALMTEEDARNHQQYLDNFHPDTARIVNRTREIIARRRDGRRMTCSLRLQALTLPAKGEQVFIAFFKPTEDRHRLALMEQINFAAFDMSVDGMILTDEKGNILRVNEACATFFGYDREELVEQNVKVLMPSDIAARHDDYLASYAKSGVKRKIDSTTIVHGITKSGTKHRLHLTVKEIVSMSEHRCFLGFLKNDVRIRTIEASSSIHESLLALSPVPILVGDERGVIREVSRSAMDTLQYRQDELVGMNIKDVLPPECGNPSEVLYVEKHLEPGSGHVVSVEPMNLTARKKDESTFPVVLSQCTVPRENDLDANVAVAYLNDFSKTLKLIESGNLTYAILLSNVFPVIVMSITGIISFINTAGVACFGYTSAEELQGKSCGVLGHAEVRVHSEVATNSEQQTWLGDYATTRDDSGLNVLRTVICLRRDGTEFPAELRLAKIPSVQGAESNLIAFLRDLTTDMQVRLRYHVNETMHSLCPSGILVVSVEGRVESMSPAAEECFGYHSSEVLGASIQVLIPMLGKVVEAEDGERATPMATWGSRPRRLSRPTNVKGGRSGGGGGGANDNNHHGGDASDATVAVGEIVNEQRVMTAKRCDGRLFSISVFTQEVGAAIGPGHQLFVLYCDDISQERENREKTSLNRQVRGQFDLPIVQLDRSGTIVYANAPFYSELRYDGSRGKTDPVGKSFSTLFASTEDATHYMHRLQHAAGMATTREEERRRSTVSTPNAVMYVLVPGERHVLLRRGDHSELLAHCRLAVVRSKNTGSINFVAYLTGAEDEREAHARNHLTNAILEASSIPMVVADYTGCIYKVSASLAKLFGYDAVDDLVGQPVGTLVPDHLAVDHANYILNYITTRKKGIMLGNRVTQMARHRDGSTFPVEVHLRAIDEGGDQPIFMATIISTAEDTQAAQSAKMTSQMLRQMSMPVLVTNREGILENVNAALCEAFGYDEEAELIGQDVSILMLPEEAQFHRRHIANYFKTGIRFSLDNTILRTVRKKGGEIMKMNVLVKQVDPVSGDKKDIRFIGYLSHESTTVENATSTQISTIRRGAAGTPALGASNTGGGSTGAASRAEAAAFSVGEVNDHRVRPLSAWLKEELGIPFIVTDEDGMILCLSQAAETICGCSSIDVVERPLAAALSRDAQRTKVSANLREIYEALANDRHSDARRGASAAATRPWTITAQRRSGECFPLLLHFKPVESDGATLHNPDVQAHYSPQTVYVVHLEDLTQPIEHRRLKEICDDALARCRVPTIIMDIEGKVKLFNEAAEKCFGWLADDVLGNNVSMLMPEATAAMHDGFVQAYLLTRERHIIGGSRAITAKRRNQTTFAATLFVNEVEEAHAHFFLGHIIDVSEDARIEVMAVLSRTLVAQSSEKLVLLDEEGAIQQLSPAAHQLLGLTPPTPQSMRANNSNNTTNAAAGMTTADFFTPSVSKLFSQFVQQHREAAAAAAATTATSSSGVVGGGEHDEEWVRMMEDGSSAETRAKAFLAKSPETSFPSVFIRRSDDTNVAINMQVRLVLCGPVMAGTLLKLEEASEEVLAGSDREQENRALAEGTVRFLSRPLFIVNRSGQIVLVNPSLAKLLGYREVREAEQVLVGQRINAMLPQMSVPELKSGRGGGISSPSAESAREHKQVDVNLYEHERSCIHVLDAFLTHTGEDAAGGGGGGRRKLNAMAANGATMEVYLERFSILKSGDGGSGAARYDLHFYVGEVRDVESVRRDAVLDGVSDSLLQLSPVAMVMMDQVGNIVEVNDALERLFDFKREHLINKSVMILLARQDLNERSSGDRVDELLPEGESSIELETRTGIAFPATVFVRRMIINGRTCAICYVCPEHLPDMDSGGLA